MTCLWMIGMHKSTMWMMKLLGVRVVTIGSRERWLGSEVVTHRTHRPEVYTYKYLIQALGAGNHWFLHTGCVTSLQIEKQWRPSLVIVGWPCPKWWFWDIGFLQDDWTTAWNNLVRWVCYVCSGPVTACPCQAASVEENDPEKWSLGHGIFFPKWCELRNSLDICG